MMQGAPWSVHDGGCTMERARWRLHDGRMTPENRMFDGWSWNERWRSEKEVQGVQQAVEETMRDTREWRHGTVHLVRSSWC